MSISSAMNELIAVNPSLTRRQLFKSGMNIGRDMVGTMTNTLILALVGIGLQGLGVPWAVEIAMWLLAAGSVFTVLQRLVMVGRGPGAP